MREDGEHLVGANDHEDVDQGSIPHAPDAPKTRLQAGMDRSAQGRHASALEHAGAPAGRPTRSDRAAARQTATENSTRSAGAARASRQRQRFPPRAGTLAAFQAGMTGSQMPAGPGRRIPLLPGWAGPVAGVLAGSGRLEVSGLAWRRDAGRRNGRTRRWRWAREGRCRSRAARRQTRHARPGG